MGATRNAYSTWTRTAPASKTGHAAVLVALGAASEHGLLALVFESALVVQAGVTGWTLRQDRYLILHACLNA